MSLASLAPLAQAEVAQKTMRLSFEDHNFSVLRSN